MLRDRKWWPGEDVHQVIDEMVEDLRTHAPEHPATAHVIAVRDRWIAVNRELLALEDLASRMGRCQANNNHDYSRFVDGAQLPGAALIEELDRLRGTL